MTHQPLTKAEREELRRVFAQVHESNWHPVPRLLADLDAAEAERDTLKAKLAALAQAACDYQLHYVCNGRLTQKVLDEAIAAARGGAQ